MPAQPPIFGVEYLEHITAMSSKELDALPFGAIQVDETGNVLAYNAFEAALSGLRPERVIGRDFFTEVAPCTNVREFAGRYRDGVQSGQLHVVFPYEFRFAARRVEVTITLVWRRAQGWVFVNRREA